MANPVHPRDDHGPGSSGEAGTPARKHTAGLLDIRTIIGALLAAYGVILTVAGLVSHSAADDQKTAGINANLWAGLALLAVGAVFLLWARLRPVVVPETVDRDRGPSPH